MNFDRKITSQERPSGLSSGGFTLVELLVVVAIIVILSTVGIASYQGATKSGRDGKRKGDLSQVQAALELYRSQYSTYPGGNYSAMIGILSNAKYISNPTPQDPKGASNGYTYTVGVPASTYTLCANIEDTTKGNSTSNTQLTNSASGSYYCVTQP